MTQSPFTRHAAEELRVVRQAIDDAIMGLIEGQIEGPIGALSGTTVRLGRVVIALEFVRDAHKGAA